MSYEKPSLPTMLLDMVDLKFTSAGFFKNEKTAIKVFNTNQEKRADYIGLRGVWFCMNKLFVSSILDLTKKENTFTDSSLMKKRADALVESFHPNGRSWVISGNRETIFLPGGVLRERTGEQDTHTEQECKKRLCWDRRMENKTVMIVGPGLIPATYHGVREQDTQGNYVYYTRTEYDMGKHIVLCYHH